MLPLAFLSASFGTDSAAAAGARSADLAGSAPVGTAAYAVPSGAKFAAPWGSDAAVGTLAQPVRTLARAVTLAPDGGTVVLRAGSYHESVAINTKRVTIQNYPSEAVWMDGSSAVSGWVKSGTSTWVKTGWITRFDSSPTYTKGAPDGPAPYGAFVNPAYPMAAHPDQVFRDGFALRQVKTLAQVTAGTFYLDQATSRLTIGSDPTGHAMRASDLAKALSIRTAGTVLRGVGILRYAPSVWNIGAITLERPGISLENVVVTDNATTGIGALAANISLNRVTATRNGLMGIVANAAYGFRLTHAKVQSNNTEHFNTSPASGGVKITRSRGIVIGDSDFRGNTGTGLWFDESDYDSRVVRNNFIGNSGHGMSLELSAKSLVSDNLFLSNAGDGIKINDTDGVQVWNNTFVRNGRSINLVQDSRRASNLSLAGHDPQRPLPDPTVTWLLGNIAVFNNVVTTQNASATCMVCVEDYSHVRSAAQMRMTFGGNVYNRPYGSPTWFAIWSRGAGNPSVYTTLAQFQAGTGQDRNGVAANGIAAISDTGALSSALTAREGSATPLPNTVAPLVGQQANTRHFGAWLSSRHFPSWHPVSSA